MTSLTSSRVGKDSFLAGIALLRLPPPRLSASGRPIELSTPRRCPNSRPEGTDRGRRPKPARRSPSPPSAPHLPGGEESPPRSRPDRRATEPRSSGEREGRRSRFGSCGPSAAATSAASGESDALRFAESLPRGRGRKFSRSSRPPPGCRARRMRGSLLLSTRGRDRGKRFRAPRAAAAKRKRARRRARNSAARGPSPVRNDATVCSRDWSRPRGRSCRSRRGSRGASP